MHDLIREHARTLTSRLDPGDDRQQATGRLLDYYQYAAARAQDLLARQARGAPAPAAGTVLTAVPVLAGRDRALASAGPSGPPCWPAWTRPPQRASTPGSSR